MAKPTGMELADGLRTETLLLPSKSTLIPNTKRLFYGPRVDIIECPHCGESIIPHSSVAPTPMKFGKYKLLNNSADIRFNSPQSQPQSAAQPVTPSATYENQILRAESTAITQPLLCFSALELLSDLADKTPSILTTTLEMEELRPLTHEDDIHSGATVLCSMRTHYTEQEATVGSEVAKFYPDAKSKKPPQSQPWKCYRGQVTEFWTDYHNKHYYHVRFKDGDESDWDADQLQIGLALHKVIIIAVKSFLCNSNHC